MNGKQLFSCQGHTDDITSVQIVNKKIISGSADKTVRVWDSTNGKQIFLLQYEAPIVVVHVEENTIISGSSDGTLKLWHLTTGKQVATLNPMVEGHYGTFWKRGNRIIIESIVDIEGYDSPYGDLLDSEQRTVCIEDYTTGKEILRITESEEGEFLTISVKGNKLIIGSADGTIRIWDITLDNQDPITYNNHTGSISSIEVTDTLLISCSENGEFHVHNLLKGENLYTHSENQEYQMVKLVGDNIFTVSRLCEENQSAMQESSDSSSSEELETPITHRICVRSIETGDISAVFEHLCSNERTIQIAENRIVFCSSYPRNPISLSTVHIQNLSLGAESLIDKGNVLDPGFYTITTIVKHGKIFAIASNGIIRIWNIALLNSLVTMSTQQANLVFNLLEEIQMRKKQGEDLSEASCWDSLANILHKQK